MKILYIAFKDFEFKHYGGSQKVISECLALEQLGHDVTLIGRNGSDTAIIDSNWECHEIASHGQFPIKKFYQIWNKHNQIKDIENYVKDKNYDLCYIRYDLATRAFSRLLEKIKQNCKKVFIEIATYPYKGEYPGKMNAIRMRIDDFYADRLHKYVDKIITFYDIPENQFHKVPCKKVPNGYDFDNVDVIQSNDLSEAIEIIAISSMRIWHGYERILEGLHNYYDLKKGKRDIVLHLVGDGREKPKYQEITERYHLEEHVVFHGALYGDDLDNLLSECTLGIDSLARHRTSIDTLSSLKSREYGAKGIPFINSCDIDIIDSDFKYFLKVPADESPIDIESIIEFYDSIYLNEERKTVARNIRRYIEERSSMRFVMSCIVEE